jgi:hypothetical protein
VAHLPGISARPRARTHSSEEPGLLLKHELLFVSWVLHGRADGHIAVNISCLQEVIRAVIPIVLTEPSTTVLPSAPNVLDYRKDNTDRHNTYQRLDKQRKTNSITITQKMKKQSQHRS